MQITQQNKDRRKRRYAAPVGGLFIGLAAFGVITVVYMCFRLTGQILDNSQEKRMFENLVRPLVMFDPAPFEQPTDIAPDNLLMYSMWSTLMGEKQSSYTYGETGEVMVPASDLDVAAAKLFGPEVTLEHKSFGDYETPYFYDAETGIYSLPANLQLNVYSPEVESVEREGELFEIRVGYIPSGVSWQTDFSGGQGHPEPEKIMNYLMRQTDNGYSVVKLQYPEDAVDPAQAYAQQQAQQAAG